jgi:hypothetical protein
VPSESLTQCGIGLEEPMKSDHDFARRKRVTDHLEGKFATPELNNLQVHLGEVEAALLACVQSEVMAVLAHYARAARIAFKQNDDGFSWGKASFIYLVSTYRRDLLIEIDDHEGRLERLDFAWTAADLESVGRVARVRVRAVEAVAHAVDDILGAAADVIVTGYRWLEVGVIAALSRLASDLATELYAEIRKLLPAKVADLVWLAIHSEQRTHYLMDSHGRETVLKRAQEPTLHLPLSPLDVLTEIESVDMKFELTHSHDAIRVRHTIPQELSHPKYSRIPLQIAEEIAYQSGNIRVQPLVWEGKDLLTGSYPPSLMNEVQPVLKSLRPKFKAIIEARGSMVRRLSETLRKRRELPAAAGIAAEVSGRFLNALLGVPSLTGP